MLIGIVTDVHADIENLRAAVEHLRKLSVTHILCAGDFVDYGHFPNETIEFVIEQKILSVYGNHDRWALDEDGVAQSLSRKSLAFLDALRAEWSRLLEETRLSVWHSRPGDHYAMTGIYPEQFLHDAEVKATAILDRARADVLIVGHTHVSFEVRTKENRLILNPGALFQDPPKPATRKDRDIRFAATDTELGRRTGHGGRFGVLVLPERTFSVHDAKTGNLLQHQLIRGETHEKLTNFGH